MILYITDIIFVTINCKEDEKVTLTFVEHTDWNEITSMCYLYTLFVFFMDKKTMHLPSTSNWGLIS